jgi:hypothetical protein
LILMQQHTIHLTATNMQQAMVLPPEADGTW